MSEETYGQSVRRRREKLGLSLKTLAEEAGIARAYLWGIEGEAYSVPDEIRTRLDNVLAPKEKESNVIEFRVRVHLKDRRVEVEVL